MKFLKKALLKLNKTKAVDTINDLSDFCEFMKKTKADYSISKPFISQDEIDDIFDITTYILAEMIDEYRANRDELFEFTFPKRRFSLDAEQLQSMPYTELYSKEIISKLERIQEKSDSYDPIELNYITLRSLVMCLWDVPKDEKDLTSMLLSESALNFAIYHKAIEINERSTDSDKHIPYWQEMCNITYIQIFHHIIKRSLKLITFLW